LGGSTPIQHYDNTRLEWAVSVRDITHRGVMDFIYELPIGRSKWLGHDWSRPVDMLLGGWQVNGIVVMQSGNPLVPNLQSGVLPSGTQRPNLLYEPGLSGRTGWTNTWIRMDSAVRRMCSATRREPCRGHAVLA